MGLVTINLSKMKLCRSKIAAHKFPIGCKRCPYCAEIQSTTWRTRNKDRTAEYNKKYNQKVNVKEYRRVWAVESRASSESARRAHAYREKVRMQNERYAFVRLVRSFGIEVHDFAKLYESQNFRCLGCCEILTLKKRDTHIDHCHTRGHVRGLLCNSCNVTLGHVKDNPETLRRLASYLERDKNAESVYDAAGKLVQWMPPTQ